MIKKECIKRFYSFDEMMTPVIIKVIFWILAIVSIIAGIVSIVNSFGHDVVIPYRGVQHISGSFWLFIYGILQIVLGVIFSKVFCEMIIVVFKINDNLTAIKKNMCSTNQQEEANQEDSE